MATKSTLLAAAVIVMGAGAAWSTPMVPSSVQGIAAPAERLVAEVHHKPGHYGGRGRHLGWYKKNKGKKKGWRKW